MATVIDTLITDRSFADVQNRTAKGYYQVEDLNRVQEAVELVAGMLRSRGYEVDTFPMPFWKVGDIPQWNDMTRYLDNIRAIRAAIPLPPTTPLAPRDMDVLTYRDANDIERILETVYQVCINISNILYYSGMLYSGMV